MNKRILCMIFSLMLPLSSFAFIYHTQILRRWMPEKRAYQYVIGLSDYHDKTHSSTHSQRAQLEQLLHACDTNNAQVLVEDLSSKNNIGRQVCGKFRVDSRGGILGNLTNVCNSIGLPVTNVEYRYCRVAAFGPILNARTTQLGVLRSPNMIRVQSIIDEIMDEVKHIRAYQAIPALHAEYTKQVAHALKNIQQFNLYKYKNMTVAYYLSQMNKQPHKRMQLLVKLLTFDSALLDLKMIHNIVNAKNKKTIIAIAGGSHIKNVSQLLKKIGYEDVHGSNIAHSNEYNLQKCVGSHIINGSYCVKPKPIDLTEIKKFLK